MNFYDEERAREIAEEEVDKRLPGPITTILCILSVFLMYCAIANMWEDVKQLKEDVRILKDVQKRNDEAQKDR